MNSVETSKLKKKKSALTCSAPKLQPAPGVACSAETECVRSALIASSATYMGFGPAISGIWIIGLWPCNIWQLDHWALALQYQAIGSLGFGPAIQTIASSATYMGFGPAISGKVEIKQELALCFASCCGSNCSETALTDQTNLTALTARPCTCQVTPLRLQCVDCSREQRDNDAEHG